MKPKDDLFRLIKSMSKSEKGYFKKHAALHVIGESNDYITLFNAIDRSDTYDENRLRKRFGDTGFVKNLSASKYYLFNLILKSLRAYHSNASVDQQLDSYITDSRILVGKGLAKEAAKRLQKAADLAKKYGRHIALLQINRLQRNFAGAQMLAGMSLDELQTSIEYDTQLMATIANCNQYEEINKQLFMITAEQGTSREKSGLTDFRKIMQSPLLQDPSQAKSFKASLYYHQIHATYYHLYGAPELSHKHIGQQISLLEKHPQMINEDPVLFINTLSNYIGTCSLPDEAQEAFTALEKVRQTPVRKKSDQIEMFVTLASNELFLNLYLVRLSEYNDIIERTEAGINRFKQKLPGYFNHYLGFHLARMYCSLGEFDPALKWLNYALYPPGGNTRDDLYSCARIVHLIIHFELSNYNLLEYEIKAVYRYLSKRKRLFTFETIVLDFLRKAALVRQPERLPGLFREARQQLQVLEHDHYERKAFDYFEFIPWLDSKIKKIPFAQEMRRIERQHRQR